MIAHHTNSRRPRLQFTLSRFLLFVFLIAAFLSYIAHRRTWNAQRLAARRASVEQGFRFESKPKYPPRFRRLRSFLQWALLEDEYHAPQISLFTDSPNADRPRVPRDLGLLRYFPEVESILLRGASDITDESLNFVAAMPNLKEFTLIEVPNVNGDFLGRLANPASMESLRFDHVANLSSPKLAAISQMSNLQRLEIVNAPRLTDVELQDVELPPSIEELILYKCPLGDKTIERWLSKSNLKILTLRTRVSANIISGLAKQTRLEELHLNNAPLTDAHFDFLAKCENLTRLNLSSMPIRGELLHRIAHPERIQWLELYCTPLSDERLANLDRFKNLVYLDLSYCPITGEGFKGACPWAGLDYFRLYGCQFTEKGKRQLELFSADARCEFVPPRNWSLESEQSYSRAVANPARYELVSVSNSRGSFSYVIRSLSELQEPIDNAPREQMESVLRLQDAPARQVPMRRSRTNGG